MKRYYTFLLLTICVAGLGLSIAFECLYIGRPVDEGEVVERIVDISSPVQRIADQWMATPDKDGFVDRLWHEQVPSEWRKNGMSLYLYNNDSLCYWGNHIYRGAADSIFNFSRSTLQSFDGNTVLIHRVTLGDRRAVIVLNLIHSKIGLNKEVFLHNDIRLLPSDVQATDVEPDRVQHVDLPCNSFQMVLPLEQVPPWYVNAFGWIAFFSGVFALKRIISYGATARNGLQRLLYFSLAILGLRIVTYFIDIPHGGSFSLTSLDSLLITQLLVLVLVQQAYRLRYKIRQQISASPKAKRYVLLIFFTLFINVMVVSFHYSLVHIIYLNSTNVELYNVMAIEPYTLLFYCICAVFVALRVLYGRFFSTALDGFPIWLRMVLSISIMVALVAPIEKYIGNTGYILISFHIVFMSVSHIWRRWNDGRVFLYDLIVFAGYITLFSVIEVSFTKNMEAERYAAELSITDIDQVGSLTPKAVAGGMTYSILTKDEVLLKAGHELDVQMLLPYINVGNDTLVVSGDFINNIKRSRLNDAVVVVSYPQTSVMDVISLFAYLFIWLFVAAGIVLRLSPMHIFHYYNPRSMLYRIRAVIFFVVFVSMLVVAFVVYRYSITTYRTQQRQLLNTSIQTLLSSFNLYCQTSPRDSVLVDWYASLGSSQGLTVNLYDMSAYRIGGSDDYVSSSMLFDKAYLELAIQGHPYSSYYDKLNVQQFAIVYVPMFWNDERVGYMSVVRVDDHDWMMRYSLLGNIFNVFVVLFLLSILFSMGLYTILTKPLHVLYEGLSGIGQMQKIKFRDNVRLDDEVGVLIKQYNLMIDFLHQSYADLARAEREGAWREMARQVAHEIKNPLTPMRLKVQMLQRARSEGNKSVCNQSVCNQLDSTLEVLLEQIDILSSIATEFSDLARMPQGSAVRLDLSELILRIVGLYADNDGMEVIYQPPLQGRVFVHVEYAGLSRVVGNLLQNAMQALGCRGIIIVRLYTDGNSAIIEVQDSGPGIAPELVDRIFEPNFTTKSNGSGLGLAISRQIVENSLGSIGARNSNDGIGAIFTVTLPLCT